jgi:hypothetical protein
MAQEPKPDDPNKPSDTPSPNAAGTTNPETKPKRKLSLDIDEVDVSEVLERKISA